MPSYVIPTLLLKHTTLKSTRTSFSVTKLTVDDDRNDMGSVCMLLYTEFHANYWDVIPSGTEIPFS